MAKKNNNETVGLAAIFIVIIIAIIVFGVYHFTNIFGYTSGNIDMTTDEAYQMIDSASTLEIKGDFDKFKQKPSLWVNDEYVGNIYDKGIINWSLILLAGKEEKLYMTYDDITISDTGYGTTYAFYNAIDEVVGYAEETSVYIDFLEDNDYVYIFYDKDFNAKPYYLYENNGFKIYNTEGEVIAEGYYDYHVMSSKYELTLNFYENSIDLQDKLVFINELLIRTKAQHPDR